ncbi:MAG: 30S ribosome-binding factor RbfA [Patescibacteria group bacterium]|nr:30S ribosome-binding factor RbfA [Patescibacteria group bacterium]
MPQIERVNELIKRNIADLISKEVYLRDGLITVSFVDCSPDLERAKIAISVLPAHLAGTALKVLRGHSSLFSGILKKKTRLRHIPKFNWVIDSTEEEAAKIEKLLEEIKKS